MYDSVMVCVHLLHHRHQHHNHHDSPSPLTIMIASTITTHNPPLTTTITTTTTNNPHTTQNHHHHHSPSHSPSTCSSTETMSSCFLCFTYFIASPTYCIVVIDEMASAWLTLQQHALDMSTLAPAHSTPKGAQPLHTPPSDRRDQHTLYLWR